MNNSAPKINIRVESGDATRYYVDVLILKYAQSPYGLDLDIIRRLEGEGFDTDKLLPRPEQFEIISSKGVTLAPNLLFVGVNSLRDFGYKEIRKFSKLALAALKEVAQESKHIGITLHGVNYGLDESESFEAEVAGFIDAIQEDAYPQFLELITFIERDEPRAKRVQNLLNKIIPGGCIEDKSKSILSGRSTGFNERLRSVGYESDSKPHVFVAMPFAEEMEDVFHYGISSSVKEAGFICERADQSSFTGDVLEWIKRRISSSSLLVADLTHANPNVYLEVGYAWGSGVPTVFLVKNTDHLKFDVKGQRCLVYKSIKSLEEQLTKELKNLTRNSRGQ
jgi:hypothetical protein